MVLEENLRLIWYPSFYDFFYNIFEGMNNKYGSGSASRTSNFWLSLYYCFDCHAGCSCGSIGSKKRETLTTSVAFWNGIIYGSM